MIIEIRDIPAGQKLKSINIEFDDTQDVPVVKIEDVKIEDVKIEDVKIEEPQKCESLTPVEVPPEMIISEF